MRKPGPAASFRLLLEYDGSRYHGWQKQGERQSAQGVRTVAGTIERVLREAGLQVATFGGSGRTDAGVHALGQVAHLYLGEPRLGSRELKRILDEGLPSDIAVRALAPCDPSFHARHDALERTYLYQICLRRSAFAKPFAWWVKGSLDPRILGEAWARFEGSHDMTAFADLDPGEEPRCRIRACTCSRDGSLLLLRTTARHFLRRQVRRMVGAAVLCALGKEEISAVERDLERPTAEAALRWSGTAAPSAGLFLEQVRYGGEPETPAPRPLILVP